MFVVIGTVTADLLVKSETALATLGGDGFRSNNLVFTNSPLHISMGGNGGNSAYVLAGLGMPTALCGAVGDDLLGNSLGDLLAQRGVDLTGVLRSQTHATSTSTIIMTDAANQVVFHHLGATTQASYEAIPDVLLENAGAVLATSFSIMSGMRTGGFAKALQRVHKKGGITALDVGPAIGEPVTLEELQPLFPHLHYLIGNQHEFALLTNQQDDQSILNALLDAGAQSVVMKRGAAGSVLWNQHFQASHPGYKVAANISVGAGDAFNAGFLYAIQQKKQQDIPLRYGNATAALTISSQRGILDSPPLQMVEELVQREK